MTHIKNGNKTNNNVISLLFNQKILRIIILIKLFVLSNDENLELIEILRNEYKE